MTKELRNPEMDYLIGDEALNANKNKYSCRPILEKGQIQDFEFIEKYWHASMHQYLRCEPEEHYFILTEPPMNTPQNREQIAEIMFETFNVKGLFIGVQAALALYAQMCKTSGDGSSNVGLTENDMTGTVIDAGDGITHIFPVCDSYPIASCVKSIPLAGRDMTKFVQDSFIARGENCTAEQAARIKEKYGYVCKDVAKEFEKYDKKKQDDKGNWIQSSKFKRYIHKELNGNMVPKDVGYEAFLAPEMFFHPVSAPPYLINLLYFVACRNLFTKTSKNHWRRSLTRLSTLAQSSTESNFTTILCSPAVPPCSRALMSASKPVFKRELIASARSRTQRSRMKRTKPILSAKSPRTLCNVMLSGLAAPYSAHRTTSQRQSRQERCTQSMDHKSADTTACSHNEHTYVFSSIVENECLPTPTTNNQQQCVRV